MATPLDLDLELTYTEDGEVVELRPPEDQAYKAGYALPNVVWLPDATPEQRTPGVHHCPFAPGDPQREYWLRGLKDALTAPVRDPKQIINEIDSELGS